MHEKQYCIVGTGGFAREMLTCILDTLVETDYSIQEIAVFMVDDASYKDSEIMGVPVIKQSEFVPEKFKVVVAIGDPKERKRVVNELPQDTEYASIIHPTAVISKWVEMGEGSIVTAGTILTCNIEIGKHAHLNLHTTIGHDCHIGDYFTTAPGANVSGNCIIGDCVYFGTNSSVRQGVKICDNVTIGMGGVAIKNIEYEGVYIGNPLRKLER